MKQLLFALLFLAGTNLHAQDTTFSRIYEPNVGELDFDSPVSDAAIVWDDGLITSGAAGFGLNPSFLARISPQGDLMWQKGFGDNAVADPKILFNQLISTRDSNFVAAGIFTEELTFETRPFCMKLNAMGDTLWTTSFFLSNQSIGGFPGEPEDNGRLIETSDSMLLVGFYHSSFGQSTADPDHLCLSKLNMSGDVMWSKSFITDSLFHLKQIVQAEDSSFYIVGQSGEDGNYSHLLNVSSDGQLNWARRYEGVQFEDIDLGGNYLLVSWTIDEMETGLLKLDLNGNHIKRIQYVTSGSLQYRGINTIRRSNGKIVSTPKEYSYAFPFGFIEIDEDLNNIVRHEASMFMNEVIAIPNKGIYAVGFGPLYGIKSGNVEMGVIRFDSLMGPVNCSYPFSSSSILLDSVAQSSATFVASDSLVFTSTNLIFGDLDFVSDDGCVTFLGSVDEIAGSWNETISPNPSTGEFKIDWNEYRDAEMVIYNSIGTEVYRTKTKDSVIEIDLRKEQNGMYYYRLTDREGSQSHGKLTLMK